jgi:hypothetical protein
MDTIMERLLSCSRDATFGAAPLPEDVAEREPYIGA